MTFSLMQTLSDLVNALLVILLVYFLKVAWGRAKTLPSLLKRKRSRLILENATLLLSAAKSPLFREALRLKRDKHVTQIALHYAMLTLIPVLFAPVILVYYAMVAEVPTGESIPPIIPGKAAFFLGLANGLLAIFIFLNDYYKISKINRILFHAVRSGMSMRQRGHLRG